MNISEYSLPILNIFILIIVITLFSVNFSPKRTNGIANAYTAITLIYSFITIGTIIKNYVQSPEDNRNISLGYLLGFLVNAALAMVGLYMLKYIKSLIVVSVLLCGIVIYVLYQLNTIDSSITKNKQSASELGSRFEEWLKDDSILKKIIKFLMLDRSKSVFDALSYMTKPLELKNAWVLSSQTNWVLNLMIPLINWIVIIPKIALYIISLIVWGIQFLLGGVYTSVVSAFNLILGVSDPTINPIKSTPDGFFSNFGETAKKTITYSSALCIFMLVVFLLYMFQDLIQDNPLKMILAYLVFAIAFLGYIRLFKFSLFNNYFWGALVGLFVLFVYLYNPNNILPKLTGINMFAIFLIFFYLIGIIFVYNYFPSVKPSTSDKMNASMVADLVDNYFGKIIVVVMSLCVSIALITILVTTLGDANKSSIGVRLLNMFIVIGMLTVAFNILDSNKTVRNSPIFKLIMSIILYIPCILSDLADVIMSEYNKTKYFTLIIIALEVVFAIIYWVFYPEVIRGMYTGGGKVLLRSQVSLNKSRSVGYYRSLSGPVAANTYDISGNVFKINNSYKYGVSFWVYINPMPSYGDNYYSILNYDFNPNVMYNPKLNDFSIFMKSRNSNCSELGTTNSNYLDQLVPVYSNLNFPLQKWTNVVLNYNGGRLDVFLNSLLVKTSTDVINCIRYDELTVGQSKGLNAKICNLIYFSKPLDITSIHNMYNLTKISDVPEIPKKDLFTI